MVSLKTDYKNLEEFRQIFISKVFSYTYIDDYVLNLPNVSYGGTGFYFDKAPSLPNYIEHIYPDYMLYNDFIENKINDSVSPKEFIRYTDYSVGFMTICCFRKCGFCVNKRYDKCINHSPLNEFYNQNRKKILLLDDNVLANPNWEKHLQTLIETKKPFAFNQGIDIRLIGEKL